jgi:membrane protease YdiL (CAAX protease family)
MTLAAGGLGLYALRLRPEMRRETPTARDVVTGVASAAGLYIIFQVGDRVSRRILPMGTDDIAAIYRLRTAAPRPLIAALLLTVIAPSEELFWRGLLQRALMRRFGKLWGTIAGVAAYGGVHLASGNLTLTGAAGVAGAYWGTQYALQPSLGPLLVSHMLWDVWIFLIAPTPGGAMSYEL